VADVPSGEFGVPTSDKSGEGLEESGVGGEVREESQGREQTRGAAWKVLDSSAEVGTEEFNKRVKERKDVSNCFKGLKYGRNSGQAIQQKKSAVKLLEGVDVSLDLETGQVRMPRSHYEGLKAQLISLESVGENFRQSFTQFYHLLKNEIEDQDLMSAVNDAIRDVQMFTQVTLQEFQKVETDSSALRAQLDKALQALRRKEIENLQDRRTLTRLTESVQENIDILTESV